MQTDYWKSTEVQPTFKDWLSFYEGCLHCACDHGCNQWVKEQGLRTALLFRILSTPGATTKLDKLTQMPLERANKVWFRITGWESDKFNRELRAQETIEAQSELERIGIDKIKAAVAEAGGDKRKAEELLGLRRFALAPIYAYVINKETDEST